MNRLNRTRFAVEEELRVRGTVTRGVHKGYKRFMIDDISKTIVTVEIVEVLQKEDGSDTKKVEVRNEIPFPITHLTFEATDGPPNLWALYRQKRELVDQHLNEITGKKRK